MTCQHSDQTRRKFALRGLALVALCIGYNCLWPTNPVLESLAGLGLVLLAFWPSQASFLTWLGRLGRFSYGMYLVHILFVDFFHYLRQYFLHLPPTWWFDLLTLLSCILLSLGFSIFLSRFRPTRWLIAAPPVQK